MLNPWIERLTAQTACGNVIWPIKLNAEKYPDTPNKSVACEPVNPNESSSRPAPSETADDPDPIAGAPHRWAQNEATDAQSEPRQYKVHPRSGGQNSREGAP